MKLVRYGRAGAEKPGVVDVRGTLRDLSRVVKDIIRDAIGFDNLLMSDDLSMAALEGPLAARASAAIPTPARGQSAAAGCAIQ